VVDEQGFLGGGNLLTVTWRDCLLPVLGWLVSGHLGYLLISSWFAGEALPQIRLDISGVLNAIR